MIDPRIRYFWRTFYDVPFLVPAWGEQELDLVRGHMAGRPASGDSTTALVDALGAHGYPGAVLTASGRIAIELALRSLGRPGGEVIVPVFGCRALAEAVIAAGCRPVFADVNDDLMLSAESAAQCISPDTIAVIVAHLSGTPARDLDALIDLCRAKGLALIDDAAQAIGVTHQGKLLGTFGDFGILSFGVGKPTFSLGGGALMIADRQRREQCVAAAAGLAGDERPARTQRLAAADFMLQYHWRHWTLPFFTAGRAVQRLVARPATRRASRVITALEASLQLVQLDRLPELLRRYRSHAATILDALPAGLEAPQAGPEAGYTKLLLSSTRRPARDLATHLLRHGVEIEWSYRPLTAFPEYRPYRSVPTPRAEARWERLLAIPVHPNLSPQQIARVRDAIRQFSA